MGSVVVDVLPPLTSISALNAPSAGPPELIATTAVGGTVAVGLGIAVAVAPRVVGCAVFPATMPGLLDELLGARKKLKKRKRKSAITPKMNDAPAPTSSNVRREFGSPASPAV